MANDGGARPPRGPRERQRAAILAAGPLGETGAARQAIAGSTMILAADGGARHAATLGVEIDALVGDADSLAADELSSLLSHGVEIHSHSRDKDETDLELAVRLALEKGATELVILGALGRRWDHTFAALLLAADPALEGIGMRLVDGPQEITILRGGSELVIDEPAGTTVSLLPIGGTAGGITTRGLAYPLEAGELRLGSPRGVSNQVVSRPAGVRLVRGLLAVIVVRDASLLA